MTTLDDIDDGCTHHGSPRPDRCRCGQPAAFWTLPPGTCGDCNKPTHYYDPDGDGDPSRPWCVGCRNQSIVDEGTPRDA